MFTKIKEFSLKLIGVCSRCWRVCFYNIDNDCVKEVNLEGYYAYDKILNYTMLEFMKDKNAIYFAIDEVKCDKLSQNKKKEIQWIKNVKQMLRKHQN